MSIYHYECLGKRVLLADFFERGTDLSEGSSELRLGVSCAAEALLPRTVSLAETFCICHLFSVVRALPIKEIEVELDTEVRTLRFLNTGDGLIGADVNFCKSKFTKRERFDDSFIPKFSEELGAWLFFAEVRLSEIKKALD